MPGYDSPIGSKKFGGVQSPPLREFDIPDETQGRPIPSQGEGAIASQGIRGLDALQARLAEESPEDTAQIEKQIQEQRRAKQTGVERLSEGAKRRIDILVGMTRGTHSAEIEGNVYAFQTLKSKEMREAIMAASEYDGTVQSPFEIRRQLLARSLVKVGGIDIEGFIGSNSFESRLIFIDNLDDILLNRLYDEYLVMTKEVRNKYAIKNEEEAKEVVEDLKK